MSESLPFADAQGRIVLVNEVSTDFDDLKKTTPPKNPPEDGMAGVSLLLLCCWPLLDPQPHLGDVIKRLAALTCALPSFGRCFCSLSFYGELILAKSYSVVLKNTISRAIVG